MNPRYVTEHEVFIDCYDSVHKMCMRLASEQALQLSLELQIPISCFDISALTFQKYRTFTDNRENIRTVRKEKQKMVDQAAELGTKEEELLQGEDDMIWESTKGGKFPPFLDKKSVKAGGEVMMIASDAREHAGGKFGPQILFTLKRLDGTEVTTDFSAATMTKIAQAYGKDTATWINKSVKITAYNDVRTGKLCKIVETLA